MIIYNYEGIEKARADQVLKSRTQLHVNKSDVTNGELHFH